MSKKQTEQQKQELYRDARLLNKYDDIWQNVGKCAFCDLRDKYIFFEENDVVMTISLYAYIDGHFMIIPRRHVRSVKDLTELEWETVRKFLYLAKKLLRKVHDTKGMQLVQKDGADAQSTVEHIHFHCIPFDAPDLAVWNYRKLKHTPLENVALYKNASKQIIAGKSKFEKKYRNPSGLPVIVDAIILNSKGDVLFQERSKGFAFKNDYITLPGGRVDDFNKTFEQELAREVFEETGLTISPSDFSLVTSEVSDIARNVHSKPLDSEYTYVDHFVRNAYTYTLPNDDVALQPGDDAAELLWIQQNKIAKHPRISAGTKAIFSRIKL